MTAIAEGERTADPLRVCRKCHVPHYENCSACWGFGMYRSSTTGDLRILSATAPASQVQRQAACPVCRSTAAGVPT